MIIIKTEPGVETGPLIAEYQAQGLVLVEVHTGIEGESFLGFMEPARITHTDTTDARIAELSEQNLILMDAVATLFETIGGA